MKGTVLDHAVVDVGEVETVPVVNQAAVVIFMVSVTVGDQNNRAVRSFGVIISGKGDVLPVVGLLPVVKPGDVHLLSVRADSHLGLEGPDFVVGQDDGGFHPVTGTGMQQRSFKDFSRGVSLGLQFEDGVIITVLIGYGRFDAVAGNRVVGDLYGAAPGTVGIAVPQAMVDVKTRDADGQFP